jgi:2-phospho-L-lactate guanylyltransferase
MSTWAVIPAKCFERAKSRLAPRLSAPERRALAEGMFRHVLGVAMGHPSIAGVLVITECPTVTRVARASGARVLRDAPSGQLGESVDAALAAMPLDAEAALVLMGDLPHLREEDITLLLGPLPDADVVLAPDRVREGTNALALHLPGRFATAFGNVNSFSTHLRRFLDAGLVAAVRESASLGFDVDLPADVEMIEPRETVAGSVAQVTALTGTRA